LKKLKPGLQIKMNTRSRHILVMWLGQVTGVRDMGTKLFVVGAKGLAGAPISSPLTAA